MLAFVFGLAGCSGGDSAGPSAPPVIARLEIAIPDSLPKQQAVPLAARATTTTGVLVTGRAVRWVSLDPSRATVTAEGIATGLRAGTVRVVATVDGVSDTGVVRVGLRPAVSIQVRPSRDTLRYGQESGVVQALALDADGDTIPATGVQYGSDDPRVSVDRITGVIKSTALSGTVTVWAAAGGMRGTATLVVLPPAIATATLPASAAWIRTGSTFYAGLRLIDAEGRGLDTLYTRTYQSSNPAVATVSATGQVTAVGAGTTTITASAGERTGTIALTVEAPPTGPRFRIDVRYLGAVPEDIRTAVAQAVARWEQVIVTPLPVAAIDRPAGECEPRIPALRENVQNLIIFFRIARLDGAGSLIAGAGPCVLRDDGTLLPVTGVVTIDEDDLSGVQAQGVLQPMLLHEIGHVLGLGVSWSVHRPRMTEREFLSGLGAGDVHYIAPGGVAAARAIGLAAPAGVPVAPDRIHWRGGTLTDDIMEPIVAPSSALTIVTVGSLRDLGYGILFSAADPRPYAPAPVGGTTGSAADVTALRPSVSTPTWLRGGMTLDLRGHEEIRPPQVFIGPTGRVRHVVP